jgi:serine/threonine protein phosphatase PrpC
LSLGDVIRVGSLEFKLERFNTGVAAKFGKEKGQTEDSFTVINDMEIDKHIKCSYYAVYDGHHGQDGSQFLSHYLHVIMKQNLADKFAGVKTSRNVTKTVKDIFT